MYQVSVLSCYGSDPKFLHTIIEQITHQQVEDTRYLKDTADLENMDYAEETEHAAEKTETKRNPRLSKRKYDTTVLSSVKSGNCSDYKLVS